MLYVKPFFSAGPQVRKLGADPRIPGSGRRPHAPSKKDGAREFLTKKIATGKGKGGEGRGRGTMQKKRACICREIDTCMYAHMSHVSIVSERKRFTSPPPSFPFSPAQTAPKGGGGGYLV